MLLLSACAGQSFSDTKATKDIVRQICPDLYRWTPAEQKELADLMGICIAKPQDPLCSMFIAVMIQYEITRDQSRVCYHQG